MVQNLWLRVLDSVVFLTLPFVHYVVLLLLLILAAEAEVSPVGLLASIKQMRCTDDGHEASRFIDGLVYVRKAKGIVVPSVSLTVKKLGAPLHQLASSVVGGGTVSPGQGHDMWKFLHMRAIVIGKADGRMRRQVDGMGGSH